MGRVYEGRCPECGYHRELFLGGGMMSVNLELSSGVLPSHEQDMIRGMRDRKEIAGFHVENYLVECPNCQEIMGNTMIEVTDQRGDRHVFGQYCGSCGKRRLPLFLRDMSSRTSRAGARERWCACRRR